MTPITFAVAVNNRDVLQRNLLASKCLRAPREHEVLVQENFPSAALAYNDAIAKAANDLIICIHQDMYLPDPWLSQMEAGLEYLRIADPNWGVLGCYGVASSGEYIGQIYSSGLGVIGRAPDRPELVQTLDEIVLIVRKSSPLRFDSGLPHFHLYGTHLCMAAAKQGRACYALPAFCVHNTQQLCELPNEFYNCYDYVKQAWKNYLPIRTSCITISRFGAELYKRKFKESCRRRFFPAPRPDMRVQNPLQILEKLGLTHTH